MCKCTWLKKLLGLKENCCCNKEQTTPVNPEMPVTPNTEVPVINPETPVVEQTEKIDENQ